DDTRHERAVLALRATESHVEPSPVLRACVVGVRLVLEACARGRASLARTILPAARFVARTVRGFGGSNEARPLALEARVAGTHRERVPQKVLLGRVLVEPSHEISDRRRKVAIVD